jgi:uncharacterized RDD family membrane protein YckC
MATDALEGEVLTSRLDDWRLYDGVRTRRALAFCLDYLLVLALTVPFAIVVFFLGIITLGLGFALYGILFPAVALIYVAFTLGGPGQATPGMRAMDIRLERLDGRRVDPLFGVVHTVLFWAGNVILTPLILLATFVLDRKRTVHDLLLGTVVVRRTPL